MQEVTRQGSRAARPDCVEHYLNCVEIVPLAPSSRPCPPGWLRAFWSHCVVICSLVLVLLLLGLLLFLLFSLLILFLFLTLLLLLMLFSQFFPFLFVPCSPFFQLMILIKASMPRFSLVYLRAYPSWFSNFWTVYFSLIKVNLVFCQWLAGW